MPMASPSPEAIADGALSLGVGGVGLEMVGRGVRVWGICPSKRWMTSAHATW